MAFHHGQQQCHAQRLRPLVELETEQQARIAGRAFAKQIFGRMQWRRIGSKADESAKLYESIMNGTPAGDGKYTVRAVRNVAATISEVEVALATSARYSALAVLLADSYSSGRIGVDYGQVLHPTGEREHVSIEFASLRPYAGILGMENHVLLNYSLATSLQRTRKSRRTGKTETISVPSVLHLLRPVECVTLTKTRRDFQRDYLSLNDWSVTYIVQESNKPGVVTLEVVLACSDEETSTSAGRASTMQQQQRRSGGATQKQRMWQDALSLTRVEQLVANYRDTRHPNAASHSSTHTVASTASTQQQPHAPQASARASTVPDTTTNRRTNAATAAPPSARPTSSGCCICHKRFGPFRWKRHCEVCEHAACDRCLSTIANPTAVRKKKRVCNNCLYGPNGFGGVSTAAAATAVPAQAAPVTASAPMAAPTQASVRRSMAPSTAAYVPASRPSTAAAASTGTSNNHTQAPPPVPQYDRTSKRYASRASRTNSNASSTTSSVYSDSDDEFVTPVRARRATTVTIDEVPCRAVAESTKSFRMAPSYRSSLTRRSAHQAFENVRLTPLDDSFAPQPTAASASTLFRNRLQLQHLVTPAIDYELDFEWLNIFPKAPIARTDAARVQFLDATLKLDPHSIVFLRHDHALERLAHSVLDAAAPHWHGCSINVVGRTHVYCLINASAEHDAASSHLPAVVVDDVMPRSESASAYAVYHDAPFFVAELGSDDRFHAHPLFTDHGAVSFLSLPIYATCRSTTKQCIIGTVDLWKLDHVAASSHVTLEWWQRLDALVQTIATRIEALAAETSRGGVHTRTAKTHSIGDASLSSCDSRTSTKRDDSFEMDLFDMEAHSVGGGGHHYSDRRSNVSSFHASSSPASMGVSEDSAEDPFYAKGGGRRQSFVHGANAFDSRTWRFSSHSYSSRVGRDDDGDGDSDNESTTSASSRTSQTSSTSSRFSNQRYSAADLHSAIESLLHQANETSSLVYGNSGGGGVQI